MASGASRARDHRRVAGAELRVGAEAVSLEIAVRRVAAVFVACIAGALPAATAEGQGNPAPKDWCFRGRPAAFCRAFWLTEVGQYWRLGGSGFVESYPDASFHRNHLGSHLTWEIGAMANRGPAAALGATLLLGTDNRGTRLGVKGRYRRW